MTDEQAARFVVDGFLRLDGAFPRDAADAARAILWRDLGCDPRDRATWTRPVVRPGPYTDEPFRRIVASEPLREACDALVGAARWLPLRALGSLVVRFPHADDPGDTGWHVDASFAGDDADPNDYSTWRVNVASCGRALLLLLLLSDVGTDDAPTRLRVGSHGDVARALAPAGVRGLSAREIAGLVADGLSADRREALATGPAGTVYLCHPFLVHAAQRHRGSAPRVLAQPPLLPAEPLALERADGRYAPVEVAIRASLGLDPGGEVRA